MKFTLIVRNNHLKQSHSALKFAQALIANQHTLISVYFLFDGAYNANKLIDLPSDEPDCSSSWGLLNTQHNVPLNICSASALRRGINEDLLVHGFALGSIGQLVASCDASDRMVFL